MSKAKQTRMTWKDKRLPLIAVGLLVLLFTYRHFVCIVVDLGQIPESAEAEQVVYETFLRTVEEHPYAMRIKIRWRREEYNRVYNSELKYNRITKRVWGNTGTSSFCEASEPIVRRALTRAIEAGDGSRFQTFWLDMGCFPSSH